MRRNNIMVSQANGNLPAPSLEKNNRTNAGVIKIANRQKTNKSADGEHAVTFGDPGKL